MAAGLVFVDGVCICGLSVPGGDEAYALAGGDGVIPTLDLAFCCRLAPRCLPPVAAHPHGAVSMLASKPVC